MRSQLMVSVAIAAQLGAPVCERSFLLVPRGVHVALGESSVLLQGGRVGGEMSVKAIRFFLPALGVSGGRLQYLLNCLSPLRL